MRRPPIESVPSPTDLQVDLPTVKRYGFRCRGRRPQVLSQLAKAVREHDLPFVTERLLNEMTTFVHMETGTSPRLRMAVTMIV